jgi:hypothetical protein
MNSKIFNITHNIGRLLLQHGRLLLPARLNTAKLRYGPVKSVFSHVLGLAYTAISEDIIHSDN